MDRRVKERLVGATILVVLVVLIVPELLSGPKRAAAPAAAVPTEPGRSITVDVAQSATPSAPAEPPAAASTAAFPTGSAQPTAAPPSPAAALEAHASAPTLKDHEAAYEQALSRPGGGQADGSTAHDRGAWALQLGSFANTGNAQKLRSELKAKGYAAYLLSGGAGAALRYRVRIGPVADRSAAEHLAATLKSQGYSANIVAPPR
jgi:DedD protein